MLGNQINKPFLKLIFLFSTFFCIAIITSCSLVHQVQQSTSAISDNRKVVESSTKAIESNKETIQQSSQVIAANKDVIASSNKMIAANQDAIQKANQAILDNQKTISLSTSAIQENIEAVRLSSAMIKKNAEQIQELSNLMNQFKPDPFAIKIIAIIIAINVFLIPLLMVIFMWRMHRDIRLLLNKSNS